MNKIKAGIVGGAGYTGGELIRILLNHPFAEIEFVQSRTFAGKPICEVHTDLIGDTEIKFSSEHKNCDVLFLCLPHGESKTWLLNNYIIEETKIIDLGNDFRVNNFFENRQFVYGLPEFQKEKIKQAKNIANPGCFATAIQLALLPLLKHIKTQEINIVGITGSTGAGQKLQASSHFSWRANNISPYKTLQHQHLDEINNTLSALDKKAAKINFVPWRGNFTRGIFVSTIVTCEHTLNEIYSFYNSYYVAQPFTFVSNTTIDLKQVVNTNKCVLFIEKKEDTVVIHSIIDNLLKGASGQAVQNMNLLFGFEENAGLNFKSLAF